MPNSYYNHRTFPVTGSAATSQSMRAELDLIAAGFDKLPGLTGNANKLVAINGTATGLTTISTSAQLAAAISDETGTGHLVFSDAPTLNNPVLVGGSYSPTTLVVPAGTGSTTEGVLQWSTAGDLLTIGTGAATKTFVDLDTSQTVTNKTFNLTNNTLVATSAQLAAAVSDETGTGSLVFASSPALVGTPTAPTAVAGTNTTQLATTAHVFAERSNAFTLTNKTISGSSNTLSNIANSSLTNSSVTIGTTNIALGATSLTLAGLTSVAATTFTGALTGNASTATTLATTRTIWGQNFNGSANVTGALTSVTDITASGTLTSAQLNVLAQGDLRLEDAAGGQYVALQAPATIASSFTLTLPDTAGASGQALITDGSGNLSWSTAASGDVYGPASATDNAVARFDGTTGKLIQNSAVTIGDDGATVIDVNSSSAGLRITQIGAGNALLVEDSANPDSSPFVIDSSGIVISGATTAASGISGSQFQVIGDNTANNINAIRYQTSNNAPTFSGSKANGTKASPSAVVADNSVLTINGYGYDGANWVRAAQIDVTVDGTPGTNDMPGRLVFSTTADGASSPTERMRITSVGSLILGGTAAPQVSFYNRRDITGSTTSHANHSNGTVQSDVTGTAYAYSSDLGTAAASFTLGDLKHFSASQAAFGAGSTVTNQFGFAAEADLIGATNNYGFYSKIAAGTGRWSFYAAGTADNYFSGTTRIGYADAFNGGVPDAKLQVVGTGATDPAIAIYRFRADGGGAALTTFKSRGGVGSYNTVQNNDTLFAINSYASDGTAAVQAAQISVQVDGAPSTNDMPGRLVFSTTADGASSPTERMRIDNAGNVTVGGNPSTAVGLYLRKNVTGSTSAYGIYQNQTIQSDVTASAYGSAISLGTAASAFTVTSLRSYMATQGTFGAGSSVTYQYGFSAESTLTGATNNYGFYGNIASGTGRWNFYAAGTAPNFAAGPLYVGQNYYSNAGIALYYTSGSANGIGIYNDTTITSPTTSSYNANNTYISTQAAAFTLTTLTHYQANQSTIGAGSTVTNQYGFNVSGNLIGATNNYGFHSNIASGTGRYNFYAAGTADNYMAGRLGLATTALTNINLRVANTLTGGTAANSVVTEGLVQSDVTSDAGYFVAYAQTAAAAFTTTNLRQFYARQGTIGAGSAVTNQFGFAVENSLTGATNNYGFYSGIAAGTGRYNFYAAGSAANYFAGTLGCGADVFAGVMNRFTQNVTGSANAYSVLSDATAQSDVTGQFNSFRSAPNTAAAAFTLSNLTHFNAVAGTIGAGSAVTNQYGFNVASTLTGATNNYGFYSNIASGTGRYNFYAAGTADNYFAGSVGIGSTTLTNFGLRVGKNMTGSTTARGVQVDAQVQSDVTTNAIYFATSANTQAAAFTLSELYHYNANQSTFGAGSTVTSQYGYVAGSSLVGATNNYGFAAYIPSGANRYNFYAGGTAQNLFSGDVLVFGAGGLGYTTGSGGAVTQATSRTTGVTLNKTNGAITLVSAAGSATTQSFTVTNSTVAATDTIIVNQKSGTDLYEIHITAVAAGSFRISFKTTGGTTTEQPVFSYAVIKAVAA